MATSPKVFESVYRGFESYRPSCAVEVGGAMPDYVTPVTWLAAPELLTLEEAQRLSGLSEAQLRWIVADGGIEAQETAEGLLVEKAGLSEWLDALTDLALIAEAEAKARAAAELQ